MALTVLQSRGTAARGVHWAQMQVTRFFTCHSTGVLVMNGHYIRDATLHHSMMGLSHRLRHRQAHCRRVEISHWAMLYTQEAKLTLTSHRRCLPFNRHRRSTFTSPCNSL